MSRIEETSFEYLGATLARVMSEMATYNAKVVGRMTAALPFRFERRAKEFSPFMKGTGRLQGSYQPILRRIDADSVEIGLQSDVEYARIQHWGGHTPPHDIYPRFKKALRWRGTVRRGGFIQSGFVFAKHVYHPGSMIRPKFFFSIPMTLEIEVAVKELKQEIGFE